MSEQKDINSILDSQPQEMQNQIQPTAEHIQHQEQTQAVQQNVNNDHQETNEQGEDGGEYNQESQNIEYEGQNYVEQNENGITNQDQFQAKVDDQVEQKQLVKQKQEDAQFQINLQQQQQITQLTKENIHQQKDVENNKNILHYQQQEYMQNNQYMDQGVQPYYQQEQYNYYQQKYQQTDEFEEYESSNYQKMINITAQTPIIKQRMLPQIKREYDQQQILQFTDEDINLKNIKNHDDGNDYTITNLKHQDFKYAGIDESHLRMEGENKIEHHQARIQQGGTVKNNVKDVAKTQADLNRKIVPVKEKPKVKPQVTQAKRITVTGQNNKIVTNETRILKVTEKQSDTLPVEQKMIKEKPILAKPQEQKQPQSKIKQISIAKNIQIVQDPVKQLKKQQPKHLPIGVNKGQRISQAQITQQTQRAKEWEQLNKVEPTSIKKTTDLQNVQLKQEKSLKKQSQQKNIIPQKRKDIQPKSVKKDASVNNPISQNKKDVEIISSKKKVDLNNPPPQQKKEVQKQLQKKEGFSKISALQKPKQEKNSLKKDVPQSDSTLEKQASTSSAIKITIVSTLQSISQDQPNPNLPPPITSLMIVSQAVKQRIGTTYQMFGKYVYNYQKAINYYKNIVQNIYIELEKRKNSKKQLMNMLLDYFYDYSKLNRQFHERCYKIQMLDQKHSQNPYENIKTQLKDGYDELIFLRKSVANDSQKIDSYITNTVNANISRAFDHYYAIIGSEQKKHNDLRANHYAREKILNKLIRKIEKNFIRSMEGKEKEDIFVQIIRLINEQKIHREYLRYYGRGLLDLRHTYLHCEKELFDKLQVILNQFKTYSKTIYSVGRKQFHFIEDLTPTVKSITRFSELCNLTDVDYIRYVLQLQSKKQIKDFTTKHFQSYLDLVFFQRIVGNIKDLYKGATTKIFPMEHHGDELIHTVSGNLVYFNRLRDEYRDKFSIKNLNVRMIGEGIVEFDEIIKGIIFDDGRTLRLKLRDADRAEELICYLNEKQEDIVLNGPSSRP